MASFAVLVGVFVVAFGLGFWAKAAWPKWTGWLERRAAANKVAAAQKVIADAEAAAKAVAAAKAFLEANVPKMPTPPPNPVPSVTSPGPVTQSILKV